MTTPLALVATFQQVDTTTNRKQIAPSPNGLGVIFLPNRRQAGEQAGRQAGRQVSITAGKQASKQAGKQASRQAGEQAGRQASR